jgi:hypothetical protein
MSNPREAPKRLCNAGGVSEVFTPYSRGIHALSTRLYREKQAVVYGYPYLYSFGDTRFN